MRGVGGETKVVSPLLPINVTRERGGKTKFFLCCSTWPNGRKKKRGSSAKVVLEIKVCSMLLLEVYTSFGGLAYFYLSHG